MKEKLSPIQVSILVYMIQSGVILFSLPRLTGEAFGTNGWISIIIVSAVVNINLILIWFVFKVGAGRSMFELMNGIPKWIRLILSLFLAGIWLGLGTMVMVKYVLLLKMLFYQNVSTLLLMAMGLILTYLLVKRGIYHIAKATVVLFYFTVWTIFLLLFHLPDFSFIRLTPFIFQGEKDLLRGGVGIYTALLGYELVILFLHNVEKKRLKAILVGNTITSIIYLGVCFVSFGFFSFDMLLEDMYPVVTLLEYISFPVLERVENLIFSLFGLKLLITTVMYLWASREVLEQQFQMIKPKYLLLVILSLSFFISIFQKIMRQVDQWLEYLAWIEVGIAFLLPLILLIVAFFTRKVNKENSI
jgi:spore germination protein (amino acid permease)